MLIGVGIDIVEVARITRALERTPKLTERILTSNEQAQWQQSKQPERFLAKRYAVKEAVSKALGTGIGRGVSWQHIEVEKTPAGQPYVSLSNATADIAQRKGIKRWMISYSDEQHYVVAQAMAEGD